MDLSPAFSAREEEDAGCGAEPILACVPAAGAEPDAAGPAAVDPPARRGTLAGEATWGPDAGAEGGGSDAALEPNSVGLATCSDGALAGAGLVSAVVCVPEAGRGLDLGLEDDSEGLTGPAAEGMRTSDGGR